MLSFSHHAITACSSYIYKIKLKVSETMNGPQRTACLAKGYNNDKYKWIEVLVMGKNQWKLKHILYISGSRIELVTSLSMLGVRQDTEHTHRRTYPRTILNSESGRFYRTFARQWPPDMTYVSRNVLHDVSSGHRLLHFTVSFPYISPGNHHFLQVYREDWQSVDSGKFYYIWNI